MWGFDIFYFYRTYDSKLIHALFSASYVKDMIWSHMHQRTEHCTGFLWGALNLSLIQNPPRLNYTQAYCMFWSFLFVVLACQVMTAADYWETQRCTVYCETVKSCTGCCHGVILLLFGGHPYWIPQTMLPSAEQSGQTLQTVCNPLPTNRQTKPSCDPGLCSFGIYHLTDREGNCSKNMKAARKRDKSQTNMIKKMSSWIPETEALISASLLADSLHYWPATTLWQAEPYITLTSPNCSCLGRLIIISNNPTVFIICRNGRKVSVKPFCPKVTVQVTVWIPVMWKARLGVDSHAGSSVISLMGIVKRLQKSAGFIFWKSCTTIQ